MRVSVNYFFENTSFRVTKKRILTTWIKSIIACENKKAGEICFIFCDDSYLSRINSTYLKRETFTDVIAFDYSENGLVSGDIFISIDRVKYNSNKFKKSFIEELFRVMAHGVLHLTGYSDNTKRKRLAMTDKENIYINDIYNKFF